MSTQTAILVRRNEMDEGGKPDEYLPLHEWFDELKKYICDFRHRALRHHASGIYEAERVFGRVITNSDGGSVPTRILGEQHVREDCGRIPSLGDWLKTIRGERWMISPRGQDATSQNNAVTGRAIHLTEYDEDMIGRFAARGRLTMSACQTKGAKR